MLVHVGSPFSSLKFPYFRQGLHDYLHLYHGHCHCHHTHSNGVLHHRDGDDVPSRNDLLVLACGAPVHG